MKRNFFNLFLSLFIRSEVFAAMFNQPMREARDNIVEITDAEPECVKNFLRSFDS